MANTIKLKQGSGSDPSASDLALGEPAIRTDTGEIFLKKDDGSIAKVAGGIDDGDKGDIVVSNDGATFTVDAGVITNAKVSGSAAIAGTKISPNFGSQNIVTSSNLNVNGGQISISGSTAAINFTDNEDNPDYRLVNSSGIFKIRDNTNGVDRLKVNTDGHIDIDGNLDVGAGIDVTGNVACDGIRMGDSDEIRLGNSDDLKIFHSGSHSRILDNGTGKLQFGSDTGVEILTGNFATQIALFDSSQILLKENTSVTGNISVSGTVDGRDLATDGSKLDGIESGATADQTKSDIDALNINADTVDSLHASSFLRSDTADTASGDITFSGGAGAVTIAAASDIRLTNGSWTGNAYAKIQLHSNRLYIAGGSETEYSLTFRYDGSDRIYMRSNGTFYPTTDSLSDLGKSGTRWANVYSDTTDTNLVTSNYARIGNGIIEVKAAIATSYTLTSGYNAMAVSPTVNNGVTVTVPSGAVWAIV